MSLIYLAFIFCITMETIDITSAGFSLDNVPNFNNLVSNSFCETISLDYTLYIYIAVSILVIGIGYVIYTFYINKKTVTFQNKLDECYEDYCPML